MKDFFTNCVACKELVLKSGSMKIHYTNEEGEDYLCKKCLKNHAEYLETVIK